jgi:hypothetical protein
MQLLSWLRKKMTGRPQTPRTLANRPAQRFRPQLEALEGRNLPSTLTVMNNLDSGTGSLRAEIAAANAGDTINFDPSLDGKTITLNSSDLVINKSLTIQGPGPGLLTISGTGNLFGSRVFEVDDALTNLNLSGLSIIDGDGYASNYVGPGGSEGNPMPYDGLGGAILNFGVLTMSGCSVFENSASFAGGGIWNAGTLTLSASYLEVNSATDGGGILNHVEGTCTISDCTVSFNSAYYFAGSASAAGGGYGGGISNGGSLTISGSTLSNNTASYEGGGIDDGGTTVLNGCTVSGNRAGSSGGGLYIEFGTAVNLDSFTLANTIKNTPNNIVGPYATTTTIPAAPTNLNASARLRHGSVQVQLQWSDNPNSQSGVIVQRSSDGGVTWTTIVVLSGNANTYTDTTAAANITYQYRVAGYNAFGDSPFSNVVPLTTP